MDRKIIIRVRIIGALFTLLAAVCFAAVLGFINQGLGGLSAMQLLFTGGFWLGILGLYGTYAYFHIKNKPFNSFKGNRTMLMPALLFLAFSMFSIYYQFIVIGHAGWYKTITLVVGWVTLGLVVFFLAILLFVRISFARRGKEF